MLIYNYKDILTEKNLLIIKKYKEGADLGISNAFSVSDVVLFKLRILRKTGITRALMRIERDGEMTREIEFSFSECDGGYDIYAAEIDMRLISENACGLFFYDFVFYAGRNAVFYSESLNNSDVSLLENEGGKFLLLLSQDGFKTPLTFRQSSMYHIFVDRFYKGKTPVPVRGNAKINPDWDNGVPEFAAVCGDHLDNNEFFGGTLWGIIEKLDYIQEMGFDCIYLSPVFKAYSNHKYDTGDYLTIDEMFGGEEAFEKLISECRARKIRIILDGVFNHTGDDSIYFNRRGTYGVGGAYRDYNSEYHSWYTFTEFPDKYEAWWGIPILPRLNSQNKECREFLAGAGGVCEKYIKAGIGGWRLDVADELSDEFLNLLRKTVKSANEDAVIIGEVWENAASKISYGKRRRYFQGEQLDSVMNYPLKNAIIDFINSGDCSLLYDTLTMLYSSYPRCVCDCLMNILGTHDTDRIITVLAGDSPDGKSNAQLSETRMSPEQIAAGIAKLKLASVIQYTVFGVPSVFYGDEAGLEGYHDPFCRMPYPWGRERGELIEHYKTLGKIRKSEAVFDGGDFEIAEHSGGLLGFSRKAYGEEIRVYVNGSKDGLEFPADGNWKELLSGGIMSDIITLSPQSAYILKRI